MPKKQAFIIPQGLQFEQTDKGITIENQGDIVLKGSLGKIHRLISTDGDIHIEQPMEITEIVALNGRVSSDSTLNTSTIQAKELEIGTDLTVHKRIHVSKSLLVHGNVQCERLQSLGSIEVQGSVTCDELTVEGNAHITEDLHAKVLTSQSHLIVHGETVCNEFVHTGEVIKFGVVKTPSLHAPNASISIAHTLECTAVRCHSLEASGTVASGTIQADNQISIIDGTIQSDVVLCQNFETQGEVSGKILVLEAPSQSGSHRIKGCLELADFADLVPDLDAFLASKGLERQAGKVALSASSPLSVSQEIETLEESSESESDSIDESTSLHVNLNALQDVEPSTSASVHMIDEDEAIAQVDDELSVEMNAEPARIAVPMIETEPTTPINPSINEGIVESVDSINIEQESISVELQDPQDSSKEDLAFKDAALNTESSVGDDTHNIEAPLSELSADSLNDDEISLENSTVNDETTAVEPETPLNPLFIEIRANIQDLLKEYESAEAPLPIQELASYLESEDYLALQDELRHIWSRLLRHHQTLDSRIPSAATMAFTHLGKNLKKL